VFPRRRQKNPSSRPLCPSSTFTRPLVPYPPPSLHPFILAFPTTQTPDGTSLPRHPYLRSPPSSAIQPANGGSVHAANEGPNRMSRASPAPITAAFNIPLASSASRKLRDPARCIPPGSQLVVGRLEPPYYLLPRYDCAALRATKSSPGSYQESRSSGTRQLSPTSFPSAAFPDLAASPRETLPALYRTTPLPLSSIPTSTPRHLTLLNHPIKLGAFFPPSDVPASNVPSIPAPDINNQHESRVD
jgi:hypothetical protein